jgi:hypothetical protein
VALLAAMRSRDAAITTCAVCVKGHTRRLAARFGVVAAAEAAPLVRCLLRRRVDFLGLLSTRYPPPLVY